MQAAQGSPLSEKSFLNPTILGLIGQCSIITAISGSILGQGGGGRGGISSPSVPERDGIASAYLQGGL